MHARLAFSSHFQQTWPRPRAKLAAAERAPKDEEESTRGTAHFLKEQGKAPPYTVTTLTETEAGRETETERERETL